MTQQNHWAFRYALPIAALIVSAFVFIIRRPDLITDPAFWAEDGVVWYAQAYNNGIVSLFWTQAGYYQTISRIVAYIALYLPMEQAPLILNIAAIAIRSFFVAFILSPRLRALPLWVRIITSIYIMIMPNITEVHANITNTQWYLALWLLFTFISDVPNTRLWKIHDIALTILAGLTGPYIVFLVPVVLLRYVSDADYRAFAKTTFGRIFLLAFVAVCLVQFVAILLLSGAKRSHAPLGFSFTVLADILSSRIFIGAFLSGDQAKSMFSNDATNAVVSIVSLGVLCYAMIKLDWRGRCIIVFSTVMIGLALAKPTIHATLPQLPRLSAGSSRYFVITNIAWVAILFLVFDRVTTGIARTKRITIAIIPISMMAYFSLKDFWIQPWPKTYWKTQVAEFKALPTGAVHEFKVNPGWSFKLVKKAN